jgi:NAD(P)-dependent dehydrogenase (short-subunit alcohol dehydrogenase family)
VDRFGRLDILVNNAGIDVGGGVATIGAAQHQRVIEVNLLGTMWMCRSAWSHMTGQRYGRIVNTASMAGYLGVPQHSAYSASKAGVIGLSRALAQEGAAWSIMVNALAPGANTPMTDGHFGPLMQQQLDPVKVSAAVALLAHDTCPVTGAVVLAEGGRYATVVAAQSEGTYFGAPTAEALRDRWGEISSRRHLELPDDVVEEMELLLRHVPPAVREEFGAAYQPPWSTPLTDSGSPSTTPR